MQHFFIPLNLWLLFLFVLFTGANTGLGAQATDDIITWRQAQRQKGDWYATPAARRIADNLLVYQHATGGWPKNIDMAAPLSPQDVKEIERAKTDPRNELGRPTIDNGATYPELRFLARVYEQNKQDKFKRAFLHGLDYLLEAQYENGGWPQFYPLREGYYSHITFNDGAMIGVMEFLREVAEGQYPFVDEERVLAARQSIDKGVEVILKMQVEVDGKLTVWCAQHDPVTLAPAKARAYELVSLSGSESAGVVEFLMGIEEPSPEVIRAVRGAVDWFGRVQLRGLRLLKTEVAGQSKDYDLLIAFDPESDRSYWARFYEIGTNYPIFVGRDGIVKYTLAEIEYERRVNYKWLGEWPHRLLERDYPAWLKKNNL